MLNVDEQIYELMSLGYGQDCGPWLGPGCFWPGPWSGFRAMRSGRTSFPKWLKVSPPTPRSPLVECLNCLLVERIHRRTLEACEETLGHNHSLTVASASNLAMLLRGMGKHERIHRRALKPCAETLDHNHSDTLASAGNLAGVLRDTGNYQEAARIHHRTLEACKETLGHNHPDTLSAASNLATLLRDMGKHPEAEHIHRRTVKSREGPNKVCNGPFQTSLGPNKMYNGPFQTSLDPTNVWNGPFQTY